MDEMRDLVSIVIPIYNIEDVIIHSLDAVIDQTYKNIELILVDDGSTDHSIKVAKDYLALRRMDYQVLVQPNRGPSAARNNGIRSAKGNGFYVLTEMTTFYRIRFPQWFKQQKIKM